MHIAALARSLMCRKLTSSPNTGPQPSRYIPFDDISRRSSWSENSSISSSAVSHSFTAPEERGHHRSKVGSAGHLGHERGAPGSDAPHWPILRLKSRAAHARSRRFPWLSPDYPTPHTCTTDRNQWEATTRLHGYKHCCNFVGTWCNFEC
jgi:hypothetical protein